MSPAYAEAQEHLRLAQNILDPLVADQEAKLEFGRVHTLFCEVRCDRGGQATSVDPTSR